MVTPPTERTRRSRAKRRAQGRCWWCTADAEPGRTLCARHAAKSRAAVARHRERQKTA